MIGSELECVLRLIIALICGAAVGLEREKKNPYSSYSGSNSCYAFV